MQELIHKDHKFEYYKVAMLSGKWMSSCNVVEACKAVGMKAVCEGPIRSEALGKPPGGVYCQGSNAHDCYVTQFSGKGNGPGRHYLSRRGCDGLGKLPTGCGKGRKCEKFENVFTYYGTQALTNGEYHVGLGYAGPACAPCIGKDEKPEPTLKLGKPKPPRRNNGGLCELCETRHEGLDFYKAKTSFYAFCAKPVS